MLFRSWVITATVFSWSAFGPRSFGVWAQDQAMCRAKGPATTSTGGPVASPGFSVRAAGWEWVRFFLARSSLTRRTAYCPVGAHVWIPLLCRSRTRLGKIHVLSVPYWTARVVVLVSMRIVITITCSFGSVYFRALLNPADKLHAELRSSPTRGYLGPRL